MTAGRLGDERGIVGSFVVKLVVLIGILGLVAVEGSSVLFARLRAQDAAETAASVAASTLASTGDPTAAHSAAQTAIADKDATVRLLPGRRGFRILDDGGVEVTVKKRASTLVVQHIGFLEGLAVARASAVGRPPPA